MDYDLENYTMQLQQVELALLADPENAELLKIKSDLEEVIQLTRELLKTQSKKPTYTVAENASEPNPYDEVEAALLSVAKLIDTACPWKVGDKCLAKWNEDGKYYEASIEEIKNEREVNVIFTAYGNRSTTTLDELRAYKASNDAYPGTSSKRQRRHEKEYLKRKKEKKQQRMKELVETHESVRSNWLKFATKSEKKSGFKNTKSIFVSPSTVAGRVGVGTCGIAGKGMTKFK